MGRRHLDLSDQEPLKVYSLDETLQSVGAFEESKPAREEADGAEGLWSNQLIQRLSEGVSAYLAQDGDGSDAHETEAEIFQTVVDRLSAALMGNAIAIAFPSHPNPDSAHSNPLFTLRYTAQAEQPLEGRAVSSAPIAPSRLPSGNDLSFEVGKTLTQQELRSLKRHYPGQVWQILTHQAAIGWLLIPPVPSSPLSLDNPELATTFQSIQQVVSHCALAIEQVRLVAVQHQKYHALLARNQELEQTNQLKSEFLANTSHEIRTPLSSILGFTHLLQQQGFNPTNLRHQEYLKIILTSGQHLLALINDILDLSKIEANQLTLQWELIKVDELCKMALMLVKEKASDKGLDLHLELAPGVTTLVADSLRLKQMLFNLLSNAVKFTLRGTVGLQVIQADNFLYFTVWDTGTGISKDQQALLFKPYSQVANSAVVRGEGTGLGLVLTQKLAELHGGRVEVLSELDQGSRFTIALPLNIQETAIAQPIQPISGIRVETAELAAESAGTPANLRPNGILLVEDNIPNAKLVLTYLSRLGYEVTWAKDGKEFWQAIERSLPAMILMDVHLPDVDGLTLIRQLKTDDRYRDIPVITQTAMAMKGDRDLCLEAGAKNYISKPIDLDALAKLVAEYVGVGGRGK